MVLTFILAIQLVSERIATTIEMGYFRFQSKDAPLPQYPSHANSSGIVVLRLLVDSDGNVLESKTLEATQSSMEREAVLAVQKWRFRSNAELGWQPGRPEFRSGRLVFYFNKVAGRQGTVIDAAAERLKEVRARRLSNERSRH